MIARTATLVAALSLGAFATSAFAGEGRNFTAWGHEFEAPGFAASIPAPSAPSSYTVLSAAPATSSRVLPIARHEFVAAPVTSMPEPTINVWGARFPASGR
ncbi:hypothetical protein CIW48_32545 [Methylobacterium sp. P1-11]|uniref:hypothetical protein n=1 Tax=Methylobacterium sp. P1-11 TaxID=2024616 RepID=UPI0011EEB698|nr:hypothetical protein [Methylobacterium sp. P1-11]KAA0107792.1 hypothetical protein CIW48_32545 [Methylobacterium sp. P1-11]